MDMKKKLNLEEIEKVSEGSFFDDVKELAEEESTA